MRISDWSSDVCSSDLADSAAIASDAAAADAAPASEAAATPAFDIEAVPVSDAALGEFPYFSLPAGYEPMNRPVQMDYARFPFWTGEGFEWVEGQIGRASCRERVCQ